MTYVTVRKTIWTWDENRGKLFVSRRSDPSWKTTIDADIIPTQMKVSPVDNQVSPEYYRANLPGWRLQHLLNDAYERGRAEALEDLRNLT